MCSELCGVRHAYMPIEVRVLPEAEFDRWVEQAQAEFAAVPRREGDGDRRTAAVNEAGRRAN
jgi:cytochrome c oxidase subunit 2